MTQSNLLDFTDSESDDVFSALTSVPKTTSAKMAPAKKPRGRAAANRVTKTEPKAATRRAGAKKAAAAEEEIERQALADKPTNERTKSTRGRKAKKVAEKEEDDEEGDDVLATPPGSDEPARAKSGRGRPRKEAVVPESVQKIEKPAPAKRGRKPVTVEEPAPQQDEPTEVPETQVDDLMDVDTEEQDLVEDLPTFSRYNAPPSVQRNNTHHVPASASKRPSSSSSLESDPSVRRRLGEMAKKYEALEIKYNNLRNVAVTEAEKTFDRLKKSSEEKTQSKRIRIANHQGESIANNTPSCQPAYCQPQE